MNQPLTNEEEDAITDAATDAVWRWYWSKNQTIPIDDIHARAALESEYAARWQKAIRAGADADTALRRGVK